MAILEKLLSIRESRAKGSRKRYKELAHMLARGRELNDTQAGELESVMRDLRIEDDQLGGDVEAIKRQLVIAPADAAKLAALEKEYAAAAKAYESLHAEAERIAQRDAELKTAMDDLFRQRQFYALNVVPGHEQHRQSHSELFD